MSYHVSRASRAQCNEVERQLSPRGLLSTTRRMEGVGKRSIVLGVCGGGLFSVEGGDDEEDIVFCLGCFRF